MPRLLRVVIVASGFSILRFFSPTPLSVHCRNIVHIPFKFLAITLEAVHLHGYWSKLLPYLHSQDSIGRMVACHFPPRSRKACTRCSFFRPSPEQ